MTIHHEHVPTGLRLRPQWVGMKLEIRDGKKTKIPINPHNGRHAKTNDPSTWSDYETALAAVEKYGLDGVGYVFSGDDRFTGIDIDDCRDPETGVIAGWAKEIIDALAIYTEVSPSGTGVKCWLSGSMTGTRHRWKLNGGEVEIYDRLRFFAVTGEPVAGSPREIEERQAELEALIANLDELLAIAKKKPKAKPAGKKTNVSDAAVLKRLKPKAICQRLLAGDYSDYDDDHSTCDLVLCDAIAREVGEDPERIDGIFRTTVLMRPKWDEVHRADGATYGQTTIEKALENYEPPAKKASQKEILLAHAEELQFFHTPEEEGFAVVPMVDHDELMAIMGKAFSRWLRQQFWLAEGKAPSATGIRDALLTLEARANFEGIECDVGVRVMADGDAVYLDLGDGTWRSIRITPADWEVVPSPLCFRRSRAMLPLPVPERGGSLAELRPFLNISGEDDFILICAWLVAALRPQGPYPVLILMGEQGSAKTVNARFLRMVVDPATAALKSVPTSDRELMIAATGAWVLAYDNLSGLAPAMSDAFCRMATGGGLSVRELYTNSEEVIFDAARPITINGIDDLTGRADLLSRSISLTMPTIEPGKRRTEAALTSKTEK